MPQGMGTVGGTKGDDEMNRSFTAMHNDYLDPDRHLSPEMPVVEDAVAGRDLKCPACGETAEWHSDMTTGDDEFKPEPDLGWHCENCAWEQECTDDDVQRQAKFDKNLQPRIDACWEKIHAHVSEPFTMTPDEFFKDLNMPEGDFEWADAEAGDTNVYCCGEKDCEQQWHTVAYSQEIGRRDGKLYIENHSCDQDGNWDVDGGWEEGESVESFQDECNPRTDDHFRGWAQYWLDAIETRKDPCDQIMRDVNTGDWAEFCLESAEDNVKYLKMGTEPGHPWDEVEILDSEDDDDGVNYRLHFYTEGSENYVSEIYVALAGSTVDESAAEVCEHFGWDKVKPGQFPPIGGLEI